MSKNKSLGGNGQVQAYKLHCGVIPKNSEKRTRRGGGRKNDWFLLVDEKLLTNDGRRGKVRKKSYRRTTWLGNVRAKIKPVSNKRGRKVV